MFGIRQERAPSSWLNHHHSSAMLLHEPIGFRILDQRVGNKFNLAGFSVEEYTVTLPDLISGLIPERHLVTALNLVYLL